MIHWIAALVLYCTRAPLEDPLSGSIARGEYLEALAAARGMHDARDRRAAEVLVHYHAGDLRGARTLASEGLDLHPGDRELALRLAEIAASLRDLPQAARGTEALARALATVPPTEPERGYWTNALAARREAVRGLSERREASRGALLRARWLIGGAAILTIALLFGLTRSLRKDPRRAATC